EFRLRPVLTLPEEDQGEMVQHIVQFNLSGRQVQEICEKGLDTETDEKPDSTAPHIRRFVKSMRRVGEQDEDEFLSSLLHEEQSQEMAVARIESLITFLTRVKQKINT
ncbi:MAG: hypothetical protein AAFV98_24640, partial [Chloroflexota bacterium]